MENSYKEKKWGVTCYQCGKTLPKPKYKVTTNSFEILTKNRFDNLSQTAENASSKQFNENDQLHKCQGCNFSF